MCINNKTPRRKNMMKYKYETKTLFKKSYNLRLNMQDNATTMRLDTLFSSLTNTL